MAVVALQAGYVLHRKPYRESSLLIEAFTAEHGRLGLVARGARRRRGGNAALLQPFTPLLLSWSGRGELGTLTGVEGRGPLRPLQGEALISGFYLNEILLRLLHRHDPHPELFADYEQALARLATGGGEWSLRLFEKRLLEAIGYGLLLEHDARDGAPIEAQAEYHYHLERGPVPADTATAAGPALRGETLLALARERETMADPERRQEAKRLLRAALRLYLGERPLHSRTLFRRPPGKSE